LGVARGRRRPAASDDVLVMTRPNGTGSTVPPEKRVEDEAAHCASGLCRPDVNVVTRRVQSGAWVAERPQPLVEVTRASGR
jgi:hypothetical protein